MKESNFASEMKRAFDQVEDSYYQKIPDSYGMQRFASVKYFDAFAVHEGNFIAMEYKMIKKQGAMPFSRIRDVQIEALEKIHKAGGKAFLVINFRWTKFNKAVAIPIDDFLDMKHYFLEEKGRKSIPWENIEEWFGDNFPEELYYSDDSVIVIGKIKKEGIPGTFWDIGKLL